MESVHPVSDRSRVRRRPDRGRHDRAFIHSVLDEALICHVGFSSGGAPVVLPTIHARVGERLYLHGAVASHMLRTLATGAPACVTATLIDALVLARSAFHHSMNYRSAVLFGTARSVTEPAERAAALDALVDHVMIGRRGEVRPPNAKELAATRVIRFDIEEASGKARTGPPIDDAEDLALPCWAGLLPVAVTAMPPVPAPEIPPDRPVPAHVAAWRRPRRDR